jgi:MFS family permease
MTVWALIGLGYPLYNNFLPYLQSLRGVKFGDGSTYITYRDSLIIASVGIPGALLGGYLVEVPRLGRKGTLCLATLFTGGFLYGSTSALTSGALLGWNCGFNFTGNIMYAVLYAYTPEIFPTKDRGTGNALTATSNRVFGIMAVSFTNLLQERLLTPGSPSLLCLQTSTLPCRSTQVVRYSSLRVYWWLSSHLSHKGKRAFE